MPDNVHNPASHHVKQSVGLSYEQNVIKYWTSERLLNAEPAENILSAVQDVNELIPPSSENVTGPPMEFAAVPPKVIPKQAAGSYGRVTTGKVFFVSEGKNFVCSGSVVTSPSKDLVVTAGHCVYDNKKGTWHTNWAFVPAYNNGNRPFGTWPARYQLILPGWKKWPGWNDDVGMVLVGKVNNRHIQDYVGGQGMSWDYPRGEKIWSFGYPVNLGNGQVMQYCSGVAKAGPRTADNIPFNGQAINCDMTGGCSGGPWLRNYNSKTATGNVASVNSFTIGTNKVMHGPYFDAAKVGYWYTYIKAK